MNTTQTSQAHMPRCSRHGTPYTTRCEACWRELAALEPPFVLDTVDRMILAATKLEAAIQATQRAIDEALRILGETP